MSNRFRTTAIIAGAFSLALVLAQANAAVETAPPAAKPDATSSASEDVPMDKGNELPVRKIPSTFRLQPRRTTRQTTITSLPRPRTRRHRSQRETGLVAH
ncbi:MAG: hypothetical protein R3F24_06825 [Gammaproteobacteria bacterium]